MIGIEGQFVIGVTLGSRSDFLSLGDLQEFTIIEDAGGVLPTYLLSFKIFDDSLLAELNAGNQVKVSFGQSRDNVTNITLSIFSHQIQPQGANCKLVTITGLLHKPDYLTTAKLVNYSEKKSTVEVIKEVASRNFTVVSNINKSSNPHLNIQPNITDKEFLNKIWLHTDLGDSFPVVGINIRGEFMVHDFKLLVRAGHKWKIGTDADCIGIAPDYVSSSNAGFVNTQYARKSNTLSMDINSISSLLGSVSPLMILSKYMNVGKVPTIPNVTGLKIPSLPGVKNSMPSFINENVPSTYAESVLNNTQRLASFSSNKILVTLMPNQYIPVSILDIVMFKQPHLGRAEAAEQESGLYIVTKVARTIENSMLLTTLQLNREGMNSQTGSFA